MKFAVRIFSAAALLALLFSIMSCGMGRQLHWKEAEVAGVYACGVAGLCGLIAAVLFAIDWVRRNVRVE